jgi:hypothetical protein
MKHHLTVAETIEREQRRNRMAQRLVGMAASALLLLTATMIAGWIVTW